MNALQSRVTKRVLDTAIAGLTVVILIGSVLSAIPAAQAQTFNVLYNFKGTLQGTDPWAGVIEDAAGNLYGTATAGGTWGYGTVFQLSQSGDLTVLHSFLGSDGAAPYGPLFLDKTGTLYGTASGGGASGYGVVFSLTTTGTLTVLHSFTGIDGCTPQGGVIADNNGNLYGTTSACGFYGGGNVWKLSGSGKLTVLHNFAGGNSDGSGPYYATLLLKNGNLYGFTSEGGVYDSGVVYELSPGPKLQVLHSFAGGKTDGCSPYGAPVMDNQGNLYGTAVGCGASNMGVVWELSKGGVETILHNFAGGVSDGQTPWTGVILAAGNLYGTTELGGAFGYGTAWELNNSGTFSVLQSFAGLSGAYVYCGLLRDAEGDLYGTAFYGGTNQVGTIWSLTP